MAIAGIKFLGDQVKRRKIDGALFFANHPARRGIDSPHEIRNWRAADPTVAVGFEGAPGHQAAGIPAPNGRGGARGYYDNSPSAASFAGYPLESYRTWGGFDWMTATVGGLWDSLLAEGKAWWITVNSDSHVNYLDQTAGARDRPAGRAELGGLRPGSPAGRRDRRHGHRAGRRQGRLHHSDTRVVKSFEVTKTAGTIVLSLPLGRLDKPFYVRVRGTDGNRTQPGLMGAGVDPHGPQLDMIGAADPWGDLWFYTNPIWVLPR